MASTILPANGHVALNSGEEEKILMITPGSPEPANPRWACPCAELHRHGPRNLAIVSIICGISCVGIPALVYAVKAEGAQDAEAARPLRRMSRRLSFISFGLWLALLIFVPLFLGFLSYVIARAE